MTKFSKIFLLLVLLSGSCFSQDFYLPIANSFNLRWAPYINSVNSTVHTGIKPYRSAELNSSCNIDSLIHLPVNMKGITQTRAGRKIFNEAVVKVNGEDFNFYLNPVLDISLTRENTYKRNLLTFSRGIQLRGNIGERFSFFTQFNENQNEYPAYVDTAIRYSNVVPGLTRPKGIYGKRDFAIATGTISYSLKKYFNFQFGHDKNFIGDGYRSMLLSDNSPNYPFLKITTTIWKVKYMNLFAVFQDLKVQPPSNYNPEDFSFRKKYGSFHFIDFNIGKRLSIGIIEAVIWQHDSIRAKGFDINYINPFIFFRPVEFSMGSPDNAMMGINAKFKLSSHHILYGQFLLDDIKIDFLRDSSGYYGNKFAYQLGYKTFAPFGFKNLSLLTEINGATPYTYQHRSSITNYAHYNQALAHPLGANFIEWVAMVDYHFGRCYFRLENIIAKTGQDTGTINFGGDIFKSYYTPFKFFGNKTLQGDLTKINNLGMTFSYFINPGYGLNIFVNMKYRKFENNKQSANDMFISFGIKTELYNSYFDF